MTSVQQSLETSNMAVPPVVTSKLPIITQLSYFLQLWGLKILSTFAFTVVRLIKPTPKSLRPTLVKAYSCRPHLRNRVFIPRSYKAGEILPLYLDIHGGGFALCDAEFDDHFCATFANKFGILMVSVEYGKSPSNKFPEPSNDVCAIAEAVIEDVSLPVDKSRVVMGGFSAGGNLSLSAAQMPGLKDKIKGVVSWYPVTDFLLSPKERQSSRPYRNARDIDDLKDFGPVWNWGYISPGQNLKDPLLSVKYAKKEALPKWIYAVGAEFDMLANEARQMMFNFADLDKQQRQIGAFEFEKDTYKWTLVRDVRHGFTHDLMDRKEEEVETLRMKKAEEAFEQVAEWLFNGPLAK